MILISLDPKDSFEALKNKLQSVINDKFSPEEPYKYEIQSTWPDKNIVIVKDWNEGKFFEIPYSKNINGELEIGEATEATNIYVATKENLLNSMKEGQNLILINGGSKPRYRALVQTPGVLNYEDMGMGDFEYTEEAIKGAMNSLVGTQIFDDTLPNHAKVQGQTPIPFADVVTGGYCPNYGGYIDFDVFRPEYVPTMENAFDKLNNGLKVKQGFSTEPIISKTEKVADDNYKIHEMTYDGIVWTNRPRDPKAQLCDVILNNSKFDFKGDDNLTKIEIEQEDYDALKAKAAKADQLEEDYSKGEQLYNKGKELYNKAQTKITELTDTLNPFLEAQETQKTELINSILEVEPEMKKEDLEKMDFNGVKKIQLINSIVAKQPKGEQSEVKTRLEALEIDGINNLVEFGLLNSTEGGGTTGGVVGGSRGRGRPSKDKPLFSDPEKQAQYEAAQNLPSGQNLSMIQPTKGDE